MENKELILIVEDDESVGTSIATMLHANGYRTLRSTDGNSAMTMISSHCPDLILLDLGLPDVDGLAVLESVRRWSMLPIVVVSARGHEHEKVRALDLGADDYVTKPFGTSELLARIRTALRHGHAANRGEAKPLTQFVNGDLRIDFDKRKVLLGSEEIHFSRIEYNILTQLAQHAGRVLTYDHIIKAVWGPFAPNDNQILRVNMANIRRKIEKNPAEPQYILTEIGVGYRMTENISSNN